MKKIHERLFHFDRLGTTLLVCMHFAERSKIFLSAGSHQFTLSLIFSSLRSSVRFQRRQRPISRRWLGAETVLCSPTRELQPRKSRRRGACRVLSPCVSIPNIPSGREEGDEEEKQRRRGSAERSGSQSCSTGRRQNVRRPTGLGATFTTCEGGAVEPFIPNHRTNLLGWYRGGVEVWVGGGVHSLFFNRSPSLFPSFEHCQRWRSAVQTENIQSRKSFLKCQSQPRAAATAPGGRLANRLT